MRFLLLLLLSLNVQALQLLQSKDTHNTVKQKFGVERALSARELLTQLKKNAKQGDARSQFSLANMYHHGINTNRDVKLAFYWYVQVAESGYPSAQLKLAEFYEQGVGTVQDMSQAVFWYEKAGQQDLIKAQYKLAKIYMRGQNIDEAKYWYERAAKLGFMPAQLDLARLYDTHQDLNKAQHWYEKAAIHSKNAEAQYHLANFFERIKKPEQALLMYQKSAIQGFEKAQSYLSKQEKPIVSLEEISASLLENSKTLKDKNAK
ncbi:MAG: Secretory immunoglobulin A-binding protein EsiB [Catillopecten margaritatus gill symbiont]|uniref:Secretory immunoglobulin A-binding protein EsiB n=1 Tax=Catillopecten margaritatus gill symbiont TaxID=3083288 RepID=A0AAU6PGA1_9GAMM